MTEPISPNLAAWLRLTCEQQAEAERRYQVLARKIDQAHPSYNPHIKQRQLAAESGEDYASLCRWLQQWAKGLTGSEGQEGIPPHCKAALAPRRPGPPRGRPFVDPAKAEEILDVAAKFMRRSGNPDRVPVTLVHKEFLAKQELTGVKAPGFAQVRAALHRVPYQMRLTWAGGPEYLKKHGGLPRLSVPQPEAPNLEWYLDQWVADIFVLYEDSETGRPVVVTVIDRFGGGFALGLAIHRRFTAFTVAEAIMDGIHRNGKPKVIRLDLGRENRAKYIRSGCEALGTELAHTTPRDPSVKGLMEGVHNIYRTFCQRLPWHAPSDILTKPMREEPPLPFANFCERFTAFVFGEYNTQPYTGQYGHLDESRLELRQAAKFTPIIPAEDELRILFAKAKQATVGSQGIRLDGVTYSEERPGRKLATMIGQKVWARRGRADVEIIVHDEQMRFVCIARNALAEAAGMDDEVRRQYTADRRTLAKAMATQADERIARARSKPDWLLQRAQQRLREQDQTPPRPGVRQITPVTGQTPEAAQAVGGRRLKLFRHQH